MAGETFAFPRLVIFLVKGDINACNTDQRCEIIYVKIT